ncbi:halocyanin [Halobellus sp. Atlit-38R]|jgi:plastocyanin|uniref:plastocyanin/azurin family copper-binding protein n=1 Tax=Halobellus sp. Atlit-38R TaxID=2282131 RepID=UPI000EF1C264|nr:plastocyanin/azurin family copper-binding protein [Halobellus sp. Atlit-38R]RLM94538.1 halocyanin [Halobellus sp. Atlit-38R]
MTDGNAEMSRRAFLTTAAGTAAAAGAAGTAAAQEGGGGGTKTVMVGPGGSLVFEPGTNEPLQITPGTTVEFVWDSDNHNIVVDSQPEGANWEGHEPIENTGFTYSHTFETLGAYEYYCVPHQSAGMVGTIEVVESISTPASSNVPTVPDSAKTLGVATTFAMVATLGLAFFFLKYGGDYEIEDE